MTGWWILWGVACAGLAWLIYRAITTEDVVNAALADDRHDVGPDQLRLLQDLDAHLDQYFARVSHLFEELGPPITPDPMAHLDNDAGCDRLLKAIRDHREEEEA